MFLQSVYIKHFRSAIKSQLLLQFIYLTFNRLIDISVSLFFI